MRLDGRGGNTVDVIVRKVFPTEELCKAQAEKMIKLRNIANDCKLFYVPEISKIDGCMYEMEYIKGEELNNTYKNYDAEYLSKILINICDAISSVKEFCDFNEINNYIYRKMNQDHCKNLFTVECIAKKDHNISGFSHGDFTFDNIIDDGNRFVLIDAISHEEGESPIWDCAKLLQTTAINWYSIKTNGCIYRRDKKMVDLHKYFVKYFSEKYGERNVALFFSVLLCIVAGFTNKELLLSCAEKIITSLNKGIIDDLVLKGVYL